MIVITDGYTAKRSISLVRRLESGHAAVTLVAPMLDDLAANELALLRFTPHVCGHCGGRVNLRVRSVGASGTTDGSRAHFAHAADAGRNCPAITADACRASDLGGLMFQGKQEGERHRDIKDMILSATAADPSVTSAAAEVYLSDGVSGRRPDVLLGIGTQLVCLDIQLAPPMRDTISGRTAFYERGRLHHVWVLDGNDLDRVVNLQPFQDLLWRQGGTALAFDEDCFEQTKIASTLCFKLVEIHDDGHRITVSWRFTSGPELMAFLGLTPDATGLAGDLISRAALQALAHPEKEKLKIWYVAMAPDLGWPEWRTFSADGLRSVLGALTSLHAGEVRDGSARGPSEVKAVVHNALRTDTADSRSTWAPMIAAALTSQAALPSGPALSKTTISMIDRAMQSHDPAKFDRLLNVWRPLLKRLFPALPLP